MAEPAPAGGTLFVVGTPIGNVDDIGRRAVACLASADVIAAEDTRIARTLLSALAIDPRGRLLSLYDANEDARVGSVLSALAAGKNVALISDAGMPLVSDPGYRVVGAALEAGAHVDVLPGPSAVLAALVLSGLPTDRFLFCGFLARKPARRRAAIAELARETATLVLYESPHRVAATLEDLASVLGPRRAALCRQLTKPEQQVLRGSVDELGRAVAGTRVHGEVTLVVEGAAATQDASDPGPPGRLIDELAARGLPSREIRDVVHRVFGGDKRELYRRVLERAR